MATLGGIELDLELQLIETKAAGASVAERRRIFQQLCLQWHPDKNPGQEENATLAFQHLQKRKGWFLK